MIWASRAARMGAVSGLLALTPVAARSQPAEAPPADAAGSPAEAEKREPKLLPEPEGAARLPEPDRVWIDAKRRHVIVDGYVALRRGYLEMFACPQGTKEHESVVAVQTKAATVHAALLAVGAEVGHPVQFRPKFAPPSGTEIDVEVRWLDAAGAWKSARAQEWIRESVTKDEMSQPWVFAGSSFWTDPKNGKRYYTAEAGDFICVSNFTTATLDVPIESSQSTEGLLFEANTRRIPELRTSVRLVLTPVLKEDAADDGREVAPADDSSDEESRDDDASE